MRQGLFFGFVYVCTHPHHPKYEVMTQNKGGPNRPPHFFQFLVLVDPCLGSHNFWLRFNPCRCWERHPKPPPLWGKSGSRHQRHHRAVPHKPRQSEPSRRLKTWWCPKSLILRDTHMTHPRTQGETRNIHTAATVVENLSRKYLLSRAFHLEQHLMLCIWSLPCYALFTAGLPALMPPTGRTKPHFSQPTVLCRPGSHLPWDV